MKVKVKRCFKITGLMITLALLSAFAGGCGEGTGGDVVRLAAVGPQTRMEGEFINGITMAVDEINEGNYLEGNTIEVEYFDDKRDLTTGIKIAQKLANQKDNYSAVIGHWNASINIPAATIYNDAGLLAMTPMVSSPQLTIPAKDYIFRAVPTDADEAKKIAEYASEKGFKNIAICYTDSDYGIGLCNEFERASELLGINIVDSHADFINQAEFDKQYDKWKALDTDAIFISDSLPYAADLVNMIREKNMALPILSAGGFSFDDAVALVGENSSNIAYVALYYPDQKLESLQKFNEKYQSKYGEAPASILASKGYECVYLLADAVKGSGSKSSEDLAEYLHTMKPWQGVSDTYQFKENGDPKEMQLFIVEVMNGKYTYY